MKLSICMMVKNEQKYLDKCLQSLNKLRGEISSELIIVDTGSTDNTVEIAKKYTDKVYFHDWNNNFSEMRNRTISYAKGNWIFIIDGDEILQDSEYIIEFLNMKESALVNSVMLTVRNITNEYNVEDYAEMHSIRFFRRDKEVRYEGAVHNKPIFKYPVIQVESYLVHYGYLSNDKELMEKKFKRTSELLIEELSKNPSDKYYWYQLSVTYAMHNEYDKAEEPITKAYKLINKDEAKDYMYIYTQLALVHLNNKKYEECEKICIEANGIKDGYIDIYYCLSSSQAMQGKIDRAIINYKKYLDILQNYRKNEMIDNTVINYTLGRESEVCKNLIMLYSRKKDYYNIVQYAQRVKNIDMIDAAMHDILHAFLMTKSFSDLKEYFSNYLVENDFLRNRFYVTVEELYLNLSDDDKIRLFNSFSDDSSYGILSKVRVKIYENNFNTEFELIESIKYLDFTILNSFYGDILYYLIKCKQDTSKIIKCRETHYVRFIEYITGKYDDINNTIYDYLGIYNDKDIETIRVNKIYERTLLIIDKIDDTRYRNIFYRFIEEGTLYIKSIYSMQVIDGEMVYDLKNDEEAFMLYLLKGREAKYNSVNIYISFLKKALEVYPYMKKGIELLKEDLERELNPINSELEQYKAQVKGAIQSLILNGDINNAKAIIAEYEEVIKDDTEIILLKSKIALKELNNNNKGYKM